MFLARGAVIGACGLLAAACGSSVAPTTGAPGTGSSGAAAAPHTGASASRSAGTASSSKVSLYVTFSRAYGHPARHWTLRCEPAGGNYPDPSGACARLSRFGNIFSPPAGHLMCPMIMTTAQRARVTGTYFGKKINETIVAGGCQLSRYYELKQVFN
jgi:Subtilisin inhibitor-like